MNAYLFSGLFCVIVCICSCQYDQEEYSAKNANLGQECREKVNDIMNDFTKKSMAKWNSTELNINLGKTLCCNYWDVYDHYVESVKDNTVCNETDVQKVEEYTKEIIKEQEKQLCREYPYFSSKCTITEGDFKNETSQADKDELTTTIPETSKVCMDEVKTGSDSCRDKVFKKYGYSKEELTEANSTKLECCVKPDVSSCLVENAKVATNCTHLDVNGCVLSHEKMVNRLTSTVCKDYTNRAEQCKANNSNSIQTNTLLIFALIFIMSVLLK